MFERFNASRDTHDARDHYVHTSEFFKLKHAEDLPAKVDLRPHCSPVENQASLSSCVYNSIVGAMEYLEIKHHHDHHYSDLSRLFPFYNGRVVEHTVNKDVGTQIRTGLKVVEKYGTPLEEIWPYRAAKVGIRPPPEVFDKAAKHKIHAYARISREKGLVDVKRTLASGYPIVFCFDCYDELDSEDMAVTGLLPMPGKHSKNNGCHAVLLVGYDDESQRGLVRNSWGVDWALGGYFTMPYAYLSDRVLSADFWTITKA